MITRKGPAFWALLFALTVNLSAFAQGRRNQQEQQKQQQEQQQKERSQKREEARKKVLGN